jgi:hypothetical protein
VVRELQQVEATERRRVLVLPPPCDAEILALDRVRELGNAAAGDRPVRQHRERAHARRDQRGGASEPAPGRRVGCDVDIDPRRHAHALDRGLGEVHHAVVHGSVLEVVPDEMTEIQRTDPHLPIVP